jgi:hypothetical protein
MGVVPGVPLRIGLRFAVLWVLGSLANAKGVPVHVLIDFPDRPDLDIAVTYDEVVQLTGVKHPYYVEFWVRGALAKAQLKFEIAKEQGGKAVTSIQDVVNDSASRWVYFVDGYRSKWHIDNQTAPQPRTIRFVYERQ